MTPVSVEDLVAQGRVQRVEADVTTAGEMLNEASRHLGSATAIAVSDPNGSYSLLYDAARKAVTGHMLASGYRVRNRPGSHEAVALYAEAALAGAPHAHHVGELDRMRRDRNRSEYWVRVFGRAEIEADLEHAKQIIAAAEAQWPA